MGSNESELAKIKTAQNDHLSRENLKSLEV